MTHPSSTLDAPMSPEEAAHRWTFLTNHTHVLLCVSRDVDVRLRDIALQVGITERATQRILNELCEEGVLIRERRGRRNHYTVNGDVGLRHPLERDCTVRHLLDALDSTLVAQASAGGRENAPGD